VFSFCGGTIPVNGERMIEIYRVAVSRPGGDHEKASDRPTDFSATSTRGSTLGDARLRTATVP